jgi:hypothetical protein
VSSPSSGLDPRRLSHARLDSYLRCGKAFEAHYVKRVPREVQSGAALFGTIMHKGLEKWSLNRRQRLVGLVESAWLDKANGDGVLGFVREYAPVARRTKEVLAEIMERRPDVVAPRRTKDFKEHPVSKEAHLLYRDWLPKLNASSSYRFAINDPLPALYDESLLLAARYEARMRHLPQSLVTEFAFEVEWQGYMLSGYIDTVEPLVDRPTGEVVGLAVVDYKCGEPRPVMKHYRQLAFYEIAVTDLVARGSLAIPDSVRDLPIYPGIDWVRWEEPNGDKEGIRKREFLRFGPQDRRRIREELEAYSRGVEAKVFLPAHSRADAIYCEYGESCCLRSTALAGGEAKVLADVVV